MNWGNDLNVPSLSSAGFGHYSPDVFPIFQRARDTYGSLADPFKIANYLNPIDHPWNFDSATVAKHRLRSIIRTDRDAFPVSRWVGTKTYTVRLRCHRIDSATYERKRHYRWERR